MISPSNPKGVIATVWARQGSYLVADIGTPNGRTVCKLWHDDVRIRDDGTKSTTASNRECSAFSDADEFDRKSDDLDRVVTILSSHDDLVAALKGLLHFIQKQDCAVDTDFAGAALAKAVQS